MKTDHLSNLPDEWQPAAIVFAALGDPVRQKILLLFEQGEELSIKTIADLFPMSRTAVVHHLEVLLRAGILACRRQGKEALYSPRPDTVLEAMYNLREYIMTTFPNVHSEAE